MRRALRWWWHRFVRRLAIAGPLVLAAGCKQSAPATAPSAIQTAEDCYACVACAKDLYQRAKGTEAPVDAGAE